ncbi:hypothetical protein HRQ91_11520 [Treponema parvum]|uniref:Uncharacterized protein n=1 Tax=Treponema parvum TaxID=138851 RepID=A0A975F679_9SPIR|nr:hypothetical protein [Treponema parvum]QTQ15038.1 hypothetical protein HRQ91_11520 [Treponema parvum]
MKLPDPVFRRTGYFFNKVCRPEILFILSMCLLLFFIFLPSSKILWAFVFLFFVLNLLKKGKILVFPSVIITAGIVFFSLLSPAGRVMFSIGGFSVTDGALQNGLHRSGLLCGMVFLSQFAVSPKLHLPGRIGFFLSRVFIYFDRLTEKNISFKPGSIISSLDKRLLEIWTEDDPT